MYSSTEKNILQILLNAFTKDYKNYIVLLILSVLISALYIFQYIGLSLDTNDTLSLWVYIIMIGYAISMMYCIARSGINKFIVPVILLLAYYGIIIDKVSSLDCPIPKKIPNPFKTNCYINTVWCPMTIILIILLFIYVISMSIIRVFSKKSDKCIGHLGKFKECIDGLKTKLVNRSNYSKIDKILRNIQEISTDLNKIDLKPNDPTAYNSIMGIIIINLVIILCGFNILLWFIRPEIFITLLVIQRLWFGSSYETTSNGNSLKSSTTPAMPTSTFRRKSWDLIGMPLVRWSMYLSNIDGDVTHKILYGETNRKTFGSIKEFDKLKSLGTGFRKKVTNINPDK